MNLPKLTDIDVAGKKVIVRADLDIDIGEDYRLEAIIPTLQYLASKSAEIIVIGHLGRPGGKVVDDLKIAPVAEALKKMCDGLKLEVLENLRFDPGEESNDLSFAKELALKGDVYINEAFATSHRDSASITTLPKLLPHAAGMRFIKEVENLSRVFENPERPVVFVVGGSKDDKKEYIKNLESFADKILVGGRLPEYYGDLALESIRNIKDGEKVIIANLNQDKEDITLNSIERFEKEIEKAKMIVLAGPMGRYEDGGHRQGTERIFKKIASSSAFKIVGGGDSLSVLSLYSLKDEFDWVSVGGGAMLEFLSKHTLPGIEALLK